MGRIKVRFDDIELTPPGHSSPFLCVCIYVSLASFDDADNETDARVFLFPYSNEDTKPPPPRPPAPYVAFTVIGVVTSIVNFPRKI